MKSSSSRGCDVIFVVFSHCEECFRIRFSPRHWFLSLYNGGWSFLAAKGLVASTVDGSGVRIVRSSEAFSAHLGLGTVVGSQNREQSSSLPL